MLIVAVVLIVAALAVYLIGTIIALARIAKGLDQTIAAVGEIIEKTAPVGEVVTTINANLDAGVSALEGLLVKKAGMSDSVGLVDGLYAGAGADGFRNFPDSAETKAPRIGEVYTRGMLTLARLGREAPVAAASPNGSGCATSSAAARRAACCTPSSASRGRRGCRGRPSSGRALRCSTSSGTTSATAQAVPSRR